MKVRLRVKEVMEKQGKTMTDLMRASGLAYNTVQSAVKDPYYDAKISTLNSLAEALGVSVKDLLEEVTD